MRILLLGASGRTGRLVVAQASQAGHRVTALQRSADTTASHDNENVVVGDPCVANAAEYLASDLAAFVSGQHLLITGGAPA